jgi:hypothetical protein
MVNVVFKEAKASFTSNAQSVDALNSEISEKYVSATLFCLRFKTILEISEKLN